MNSPISRLIEVINALQNQFVNLGTHLESEGGGISSCRKSARRHTCLCLHCEVGQTGFALQVRLVIPTQGLSLSWGCSESCPQADETEIRVGMHVPTARRSCQCKCRTNHPGHLLGSPLAVKPLFLAESRLSCSHEKEKRCVCVCVCSRTATHPACTQVMLLIVHKFPRVRGT